MCIHDPPVNLIVNNGKTLWLPRLIIAGPFTALARHLSLYATAYVLCVQQAQVSMAGSRLPEASAGPEPQRHVEDANQDAIASTRLCCTWATHLYTGAHQQ